MKFAYARTGGPLLDWSGVTPPSPTRAGETRSLGSWYPDLPRGGTSNALRRYGGPSAGHGGAAIGYEHNRALGAYNVPLPGAPEVVEGYEPPAPGAAVVHLGAGGTYPWNQAYPGETALGHECSWDEAHRRAHAMQGYMPEGAVRNYGQQMLGADAAPKQFDWSLVRKAGIIASAYHGVKRNNGSIWSGLLWAAAAWAMFPIHGLIVPGFAVAQGFAQPKGGGSGLVSNPARFVKSIFRVKRRRKIRRRTARTKKRRATKLRTKRYTRRTRRGY